MDKARSFSHSMKTIIVKLSSELDVLRVLWKENNLLFRDSRAAYGGVRGLLYLPCEPFFGTGAAFKS